MCRRYRGRSSSSASSATAIVLLGLFITTARLALAQANADPGDSGSCPSHQIEAVISITFDDYPSEISWQIVDSSVGGEGAGGGGGGEGAGGEVVCARDFANDGTVTAGMTEVEGCCLTYAPIDETTRKDGNYANEGSDDSGDSLDGAGGGDRSLRPLTVDGGREYTFTIADSFGDGLCCSHGRGGSYSVIINGKAVVDGTTSQAASFGSLAFSSFVVGGDGRVLTSTPTDSPNTVPTHQPTHIQTETFEPTDDTAFEPTVTQEMYDCSPTSAMGSDGYSSEFNGCITPSGCRFLATPYWDTSFEVEACWYCCSSADDGCGICSGCECGYGSVQTPSPTPSPTSWMEASEMPTFGYPPLDDDVSPAEAARIIWSDASRGTYPWEHECIVHPASMYARYEEIVVSMIRALNDHRLNWEIESELLFGDIDYWLSYNLDDDEDGRCMPLLSLVSLIGEADYRNREVKRLISDGLWYELSLAERKFLARMEENDSEEGERWWRNDTGTHWWIFPLMSAVGIFGCSCFCICIVLATRAAGDAEKNGQTADGGDDTGGRVSVTGSLVASATVSPSMTEVQPIPVASAVPISASDSRDDEDIAVTPIAKVVDMNFESPTAVASPARPSAAPQPSAPPAEDDIVVPAGSAGSPAPGQSLAECIAEAGSFGRTEAIAEWMEDNPALAAALSPDDIALTLSAISFSLDQPIAAKEIASGVANAGGSITCGHIVKAVGICDSSARLEVAKAMAPFVSDLANEEAVLGLFESSYEREQVDRVLNVRM